MFDQKSPGLVEFLKSIAPKPCNFGETCPTCGKPIGDFRNAISLREFHISGICQKCQDDIWGVD